MGKPKPRSVAIERNICRVLVKQRWAYRVQMGSRGRGHRRSKLCQTLEEAVQVKKAWLAGGLPPANAPDDPADAAPATVDDGLRHYVLVLTQPRKNDRPGQAEARAGRGEQVRLPLRAVRAEFCRSVPRADQSPRRRSDEPVMKARRTSPRVTGGPAWPRSTSRVHSSVLTVSR
jgi:hypothetical protein